MGQQLLASFLFDLSFCISTALPLVIYCGFSPSRQALWCHTEFLCKLVNFFRQNLWIPSCPRAFHFRIFFKIFFSFSCKICGFVHLFFPFISVLVSLNQVASLVCSLCKLHPYYAALLYILVYASCASGIAISSPS